MAIPALIKIGAILGAGFLVLRGKKVGGGAAEVSEDAADACRTWPSLGQRWRICHGGAGTTGSGKGPFTGVQVPIGAHYQALYHVSPPNTLVAVIDVNTYDKASDSAVVVAVPIGGKVVVREELIPELSKLTIPMNLGGGG